ncbi:MAG: efflux RND transporter permease subunit [Desulfamplus sp.]|nr:efflux RND transporter permease subunit [Desulfamplus sp.]
MATALIAGTLNGMSGGNFRTEGEEIPLLVRLARNEDLNNIKDKNGFNRDSNGLKNKDSNDVTKNNSDTVKSSGLVNPVDILEVPIIEHSSTPVYIGDIATANYLQEPDIRNRYNGKPTLTITADIKEGSKLSAGRVTVLSSAYFEKISHLYPGVTLNFGGEFESTSRAYKSLMFAFLIAVMGIYLVLSSQFNDYFQPLIILSAIPFAFIGVVFGMFFTRSVFTIGSFLAVVGLAGVAVNDAIVMIDFMNKEKNRGMTLREAVISACSARMRPVIITTITTTLGMLPMVLGIPNKSITWAPMATAFVTGLFSATLLILLFIPVEYEITERTKQWVKARFGA